MEDRNLQSKIYTPWMLLTAYWRSEQRVFAYFMLAVVVVMTISLVGMDVVFNYWYNYFYNSLQEYDKDGAISLLSIFMFLAALYIVLNVYRYYISQYFGLRWRQWLTNQFLNRWLEKRSYYYLENFDKNTDNPDQRLQEDAGAIVTYTLDLVVGLISAITTFFAFIYILWTLSGVIRIPLGQYSFMLHGYLVWVAIIYSLIGTFFAFKIGKPLISLNFEQQRREATFRYAAVDLRTHAEHVALYRGEADENSILRRLFGRVLDNWYLIILRQKLLLWFTAGYNQMSVFLPLLVVLPNYFSKVFLLGGLIQSLRAFSSIQEALSYLVNSYTTIAQWRAVLKRLLTFLNHMTEVEHQAELENRLVYDKARATGPKEIVIRNLSVSTPRGDLLLKDINETFIQGQHYLIRGPSGIGKSTFLRTVAGVWPFGSGEISLPENQSIVYLPQKPYMPIGTLKDAILFPRALHEASDEEVLQVLADCHLQNLGKRLHETAMWSEQLSPGELERATFARLLLHKPDWVFLDESTSSLDLANEKYLYELLKIKLPNCTVISIGHQPSLDEFHNTTINMAKYAVASS